MTATARAPRAPRAPQAPQAGLTLIELMVVVAVVGVLMASAMVTTRREPTATDMAHQLAALIGEASRKAVAAGPPRAELFASAADHAAFVAAHGPSARTRVRVDSDGGAHFALLERFSESGDQWELVAYRVIGRGVAVAGMSERAAVEPDGGSDLVALPDPDQHLVLCHADGSCNRGPSGKPLTIYLHEIARPASEARVVVLPLRGIPLVDTAW